MCLVLTDFIHIYVHVHILHAHTYMYADIHTNTCISFHSFFQHYRGGCFLQRVGQVTGSESKGRNGRGPVRIY